MTTVLKRRISFAPALLILKEISRPLSIEVVSAVVIAFLILFSNFFIRYFEVLSGGGPGSQAYLHTTINNFFSTLDRLRFMNSVSNVLLWSLAGVGIYVAVIMIINSIISIRNAAYMVKSGKDMEFKLVALSYELRRGFWVILGCLYFYGYLRFLRYLLLHNGVSTAGDWLIVGLGLLVLSFANYILYALLNLIAQNPSLISLESVIRNEN